MSATTQNPPGNPDLDDQAYALMQSAASLAPAGRWAEAAEALERAAGLHARAGRGYDEARCLQMSATLRRAAGQSGKARPLVERAAALASGDAPLAISISTEQAETAFVQERYQDALSAWSAAIEVARGAGLKAEPLSALFRRRAAAWMAIGRVEQASGDFDEAYRLMESGDGKAAAAFVRVEQASVLWEHGYPALAEQVLAACVGTGDDATSDPRLTAELLVMRARLARTAHRLDAAVGYADQARTAALRAVAPLSYFAASVELAEASQAAGNRTNAYAALVTAWATLSDLLGKDTAGSWVEPCLLAYLLKWGTPAFEHARNEYETRRRVVRAQEALQP